MPLHPGSGLGRDFLRVGLGLRLGSLLGVGNLLELLLRRRLELRGARPVRRLLLLGELGSLLGGSLSLGGRLGQLLLLGGDPSLLGGALLAKLLFRFGRVGEFLKPLGLGEPLLPLAFERELLHPGGLDPRPAIGLALQRLLHALGSLLGVDPPLPLGNLAQLLNLRRPRRGLRLGLGLLGFDLRGAHLPVPNLERAIVHGCLARLQLLRLGFALFLQLGPLALRQLGLVGEFLLADVDGPTRERGRGRDRERPRMRVGFLVPLLLLVLVVGVVPLLGLLVAGGGCAVVR